jgi:hypothetical protein
VNNAKWQSWKQLGDMAAVEAMRLYVRTLEEEVADWWAQHQADPAAPHAANGTAAAAPPSAAADADAAPAAALPPPPAARALPRSRSVTEVVVEGSWVSPYISSDKRPPPRYEHAAAMVGSELFIIGGNYGAQGGEWVGGWGGGVAGKLSRCSRPLWPVPLLNHPAVAGKRCKMQNTTALACVLSNLPLAWPCLLFCALPGQVGATCLTRGRSTWKTSLGAPSPPLGARAARRCPLRAQPTARRRRRSRRRCRPLRGTWRCRGGATW